MISRKNTAKIKFCFNIEKVGHLPRVVRGHPVYIRWKKGRDKNHSKHIDMGSEATEVIFNWSFEVASQLTFKDKDKKTLNTKELLFTVVAEGVKKKKEVVVGDGILNLAEVASPPGAHPSATLILKTKSGKEGPHLFYSLTSDWQRVDGKRLVKGKKEEKKKDKKDKKKGKKAQRPFSARHSHSERYNEWLYLQKQ